MSMPTLRNRGPRPLRGRVTVPGDKSISHRALLLAALASGRSRIAGLNDGDDVARTATAIRLLGARVDRLPEGSQLEVEGYGWAGLTEPAATIDAGNSGSTARMVAGICAAVPGLAVISGDETLRRRPMLRVVAPLRAMGAAIEGRAHGDRLPLSIRGSSLAGLDHELAIASAQVKTALLLAGMSATGSTSVTEPGRSRDHTEVMLAAAGVELARDDLTVTIAGGQEPRPMEWAVPGDISSALFLVVASCLVPGSELTIAGAGLNPTRTGALDVLRAMGADIDVDQTDVASGEAVGDIVVRATNLHATTVPAGVVPTLIDEIPVLAIAAAHADGATRFHGVGELRTKESDRVATIVDGLTTLGGEAVADGDDLIVTGPVALEGGRIRSHGDHRIAMAFAIAGLMARSPVKIDGWSSVETSFPRFLEVLGRAQGGSS